MMCMMMMLLLIYSLTPLKTTFLIIFWSIISSLQIYWKTSEIFPTSSVVISFSSGMMVLFCYCAMLTPYENKSKKNKKMILMITITLLLLTSMMEKTSVAMSNKESMKATLYTPLLLAMTLVIMSMKSINLVMFNPSKPLISSY
uniref:NADH dehydrogenase subunit 6 n=1 Tax=Thyreophagus entomophagus TaxID=2874286 RepID=A0A977KCI6_9ACAR|nr:NADH dehydrogenase subunit 6 [Thyreophagus entomophagus]UXD78887.1 NADH dehydrogenase subunit 6 [Thyreophagus entomophagus]